MRLMTDPWMDEESYLVLPALLDTRTDSDAKLAKDDARERTAADLRRVVDAMMD